MHSTAINTQGKKVKITQCNAAQGKATQEVVTVMLSQWKIRSKNMTVPLNFQPLFTLGSVIAQVLVGPSKQLKQIIEIEHNIVKNLNWPEANQLAIYKHGR